jgi:hypothetical protein
MQGSLKDMDLAELIQYICIDLKTARLSVENGAQQAVFYFHKGVPVHAESGTKKGEEVVYETLNWASGTFTLENNVETSVKTIERSWKYLILEGLRRIDESENLSLEETINPNHIQQENNLMADIKETLASIMNFDGAIATALVDWKSGMTLGTAGTGMNIEMAAAGNTQVVRAKMTVMKDTNTKGPIEDILITLPEHYHLIRMLESNPTLFIYVALHRDRANLGLSRLKLAELERSLVV